MIIADTDFLCSFLKIGRLELIFKVLETKEIVIAEAVFQEVQQAPVYSKLFDALQSKEQKIKFTSQ